MRLARPGIPQASQAGCTWPMDPYLYCQQRDSEIRKEKKKIVTRAGQLVS